MPALRIFSLHGRTYLKIILHIGTEKTGTTSIQQFLLLNKDLLSKHGIRSASEVFLNKVSNNFELVLASNPDPGRLIRFRDTGFPVFQAAIKSRLAQLVATAAESGMDTIVFSSEHMSSRLVDESHIETLKQLFPPVCKFKIVVYLRRQDELYLGTQAEAIKRGNSNLKFVDPLKRPANKPYGPAYYDFDLLLGSWAKVFGDDSIVVRPYERSQLLRGDILEDFHSLIASHGSFGCYRRVPKINKRLSAQALFAIARLNSLGISSHEETEKYISQLDDYAPSSLLPADVLVEFFSHFAVSNREVAKKYLQNGELFTEQAKTLHYFNTEDDGQVLEVMKKFLIGVK